MAFDAIRDVTPVSVGVATGRTCQVGSVASAAGPWVYGDTHLAEIAPRYRYPSWTLCGDVRVTVPADAAEKLPYCEEAVSVFILPAPRAW